MCGIFGVLSSEAIDSNKFTKALDSIQHRGPDGSGVWSSENKEVALGHRRLSIIDLSENGAQPMQSGVHVLTFNGEIYNYLELKEDLLSKGVQFHSETDSEVLLQLYIMYGESFLSQLDGMFSFAIWNDEKKELFCARDRFGEKPFFYNYEGGNFIFASEIKAIFSYGVPAAVNESTLYNYLKYDSLTPADIPSATFYQGINKLEKGHYIKLNKAGLECKSYYDIKDFSSSIAEEAKVISEFQNQFYNSVKRRLRADVPVGSSLSGGLDSSSIVCAVHDILKGEVEQFSFSARFENYEKDEGTFIEEVLKGKNIQGYQTWPDGEKLNQDLDKFHFHQEEPSRSASVFAQWEVMKLAKENGVTVLLDGQGADEYLGGYHYFYADYFRELKKRSKELYRKEQDNYKAIYGKYYKPKFSDRVLGLFPSLYEPLRNAYNSKRPDWMDPSFYSRNKTSNPHKRHFNSFHEKLKYKLLDSGLEDLLRFSDRNSMAFNREVRLPFLNHTLVEYCLRQPSRLLMKSGWTKYILRKAMSPILPDKIAWRKDKIGYAPPQKRWMETPSIQSRVQKAKERLVAESILGSVNKAPNDWMCIQAAMVYEFVDRFKTK